MFTEVNVLRKAGGGAQEAALPHAVPMHRDRVHSGINCGVSIVVQQAEHSAYFWFLSLILFMALIPTSCCVEFITILNSPAAIVDG